MNDAIKVLREKQTKLREKARRYHRNDGYIGVRVYNTLRECARLTVAIVILTRV